MLELGPGTGRYTRHILPRCREMILVDYSPFVCEWIARYLAGKGRFRVHEIDKPMLEPVAADNADVVVAHGVFEHIDPDETFSFLEEFRRVLRPGGVVAFDFENFMSEGGLDVLNVSTSRDRIGYIELRKPGAGPAAR